MTYLFFLGLLVAVGALPTCPEVDSINSVYFPHESNCNQFYQCSNGVPYLHTCSAGLHFNPTLNVCDYPYRAGCRDRTSTTEIPTSTVTSTTLPTSTTRSTAASSTTQTTTRKSVSTSPPTISTSTTPRSSDSSDSGGWLGRIIKKVKNIIHHILWLNLQEKCADTNSFYLLSYPNDCSKYVICDHGISVEAKCLPDFIYNPENDICERSDFVKCVQ